MAAARVSPLISISLLLAATLALPAFSKDEPHPTVEEVLARNIQSMGGEEAIRKAHSYVMNYKLKRNNREVGQVTVYREAPNKLLRVERINDTEYRTGFNGVVGWFQSSREKTRMMKGDHLEWLEESAQFYRVLEPSKFYKKITYYRREKEKEGERHVLIFESKYGTRCYAYYDAPTFIEVRRECPAPGGAVITVVHFAEYRSFKGVLMPLKTATEISSRGLLGSYSYREYVGITLLEMTQITVNEEIDASMFDPPAPATRKK